MNEAMRGLQTPSTGLWKVPELSDARSVCVCVLGGSKGILSASLSSEPDWHRDMVRVSTEKDCNR